MWLGKEAPSSLCPLGFSISCLFNTLCSLVGLNFDSDSSLCMHEIVMVLWALCSESEPSCLVHIIQDSRAPSNRSSWAFHVFEKTPFLLTKPAIPPKPWSDSSIPFVDVFTSPLWSCLPRLISFGLDLIVRSSNFSQVAGWKTPLDSAFRQHRLNRCLSSRSSVQPVSSFLAR